MARSGYLIWERVDERDPWRCVTLRDLPLTLAVARRAAQAVAEANGTQTIVERAGVIPDGAET